ncbi:methanethiol S-methyltransferase [Paractinoplanes rishiriensis]|uniref:methanethiol S-methyltransferase n=1 Tax=Paractinoplanes rishiriensis TaxID=1050105 RepID=A0A919MZL5_9ACTN|nr:methanethiol S-methyltransferase [Actinoplanes rishiriensis]GIF01679.1 membrane protein [Actinoplanes rishiriensis]
MISKVYRVVAYVFFLVVFTYTIGFLAGHVVPKGVDDGPVVPAWQAVLINAALLGLFAVQHSVMARPGFKRRWTRIVSPSVERSTYVLTASAAVALLLWQWKPLPDPVWTVGPQWARVTLWGLYLFGWGFLVLSTFALGHFALFGLRRESPEFREPRLYRLVRHPIMVGFLIAFWAVPDMSVGRLLFAGASTAYILVGVRLEEQDLKNELGTPYERYLARTPRFIPRPARHREVADVRETARQ